MANTPVCSVPATSDRRPDPAHFLPYRSYRRVASPRAISRFGSRLAGRARRAPRTIASRGPVRSRPPGVEHFGPSSWVPSFTTSWVPSFTTSQLALPRFARGKTVGAKTPCDIRRWRHGGGMSMPTASTASAQRSGLSVEPAWRCRKPKECPLGLASRRYKQPAQTAPAERASATRQKRNGHRPIRTAPFLGLAGRTVEIFLGHQCWTVEPCAVRVPRPNRPGMTIFFVSHTGSL